MKYILLAVGGYIALAMWKGHDISIAQGIDGIGNTNQPNVQRALAKWAWFPDPSSFMPL